MLLFRSTPKPIWRQTWLRLLLLSGSTLGVMFVVIPRLPAEWAVAPGTLAGSPEQTVDGAVIEADSTATAAPIQVAQASVGQINPEGVVRPYIALTRFSHGLTERVLEKKQWGSGYERAIALAQEALSLRKQGSNIELSQREKALWQQAIWALESVNSDSEEYSQAQAKLKEYSNVATFVSRRIEQQRSDFLIPIASALGNPNTVRISLCQLGTSECRGYRGDVPPLSLASLVKLPIAVALMHQVTNGQANLDDQIYIDPSNFTENAQGAKIFVDKTYTLREVMVRMITESNNIATNQLIDYLGYDTINAALKAEGFTKTTVGHKLVGSSTFPKSMGSGRNVSTADELTQMMMRIYSFTKASDEEILNALVGQYDLDFGYRALVREKPDIFWIGEKTGQNSSVIGSTVAFKVGEERYVMTVTIDKSANQFRLRQIIRDAARHVLDNGPLDQQFTSKIAQKI
ncbi:serine hydrolase [Leptolyngbyaceae cyanobacterium CCMR0082]|uniref:Serine hydrolase n=1 Tax=Adonisia turfae CCMR0082 TaxID=2304604 RepID=A0A6M0SFY6_9CYAN|nr:serine hydrolase [Adonisia turfae]NEZ66522.1 serine hydrolase [Adonisia turfae CCMR0082]